MPNITRRDLLHGAAALPAIGVAAKTRALGGPLQPQVDYPPAKTGLRGSHPGSFEVAHALAQQGQTDFGALADSGTYDLVVVGGGISGLSAAYFYRQQKPDAKILILDNHDDFGGHAKRNEFLVDGKSIIGYGGSQTLEGPSSYSEVAKGLLQALSVDLDAFEDHYDQDF